MITTKRLKGSQIPGTTSAEVVSIYDHRSGSMSYQMRIDGRTSGSLSKSVAIEQYYDLVGRWLEAEAAEMIVGMPLGEVSDDVCYTSEDISNTKETQ